ncbi:6532_t:CDS:2 [Rhizophagus irregularis]|nr:6532_t:CDS:2 [Rhizophagus irregularis]
MTTLKKLEETQIKKIFDKFDYNGNSILSLAEIDKAVLELYPHFSKNKPVIMRAYKAADISKDGYIELSEFNRLIEFLYYYDELFQLFKKLDKNNDNRISLQEFKQGHKIMGLEGLSNQELKKAFDEIDVNHGGYILFDEFCMYAAKKKLNSKGNPPKPSSRPSSVVGSVKGSRPSSVVGSVTGSRPSSVVGSVTGSVTESKKSSTGSKSHETKGSISGLNVIDDATSVTSTSEFADFTRDDIIIRSLYKLSEDLTNFLTKSKEFDVKIIIGKESDVEEFQAHSSILQARSAYFNAALSKKSENNKTEEDNSTVSYFYSALSSFMSYSDSVDEENITIFKKENISPKIFRIVLDYIYGGAVGIIKTNELSSPEFLDLLETCEELGIQGFNLFFQQVRPYKWLFDGDIYETLMESYMMGNSPSSQTNTPILQNPSMVLQNEPKAREKNANLIINENLKYGSLISSFIDKKPFKPEYPSYVFKLIAGRSVKATYPIESKKAFIFKIEKDKIENSKLSRVHDHYNALRHKKETGPNFCDLIICNKTPTIHYEHRFYDKELKINGGNLDDFEVYRIFPKQTK